MGGMRGVRGVRGGESQVLGWSMSHLARMTLWNECKNRDRVQTHTHTHTHTTPTPSINRSILCPTFILHVSCSLLLRSEYMYSDHVAGTYLVQVCSREWVCLARNGDDRITPHDGRGDEGNEPKKRVSLGAGHSDHPGGFVDGGSEAVERGFLDRSAVPDERRERRESERVRE